LISGASPAKLASGGNQRLSHDHHNGHDHGHDHSHDHGIRLGSTHRPRERRRLLIATIITGVTMVVELIGGLMSNSLALVSDAGHMFTHFFALGLSLSAIVIASRPATDERSYGFYRSEILAAFTNGLVLVGATVYILYESVVRFFHPVDIATREMFWVALAGLVVNLITAWLLWGIGRQDLNVRSAFLHMITDTLSSVAVVGGALVIFWTGWWQIDPILSALISVLIAIWSWRLLRDSANVLLESKPRHLRKEDIPAACRAEFPEIREMHDLHVWEITSSMYAMTAHAALAPEVTMAQAEQLRVRLERFVSEKYRIGHAIFQFEAVGSAEGHHAGPPVFDLRPHEEEREFEDGD
jgi:cobalt-zinc-cadmium efflux system protein